MGRRKRRDESMYVPDTIQFDPSTDDDGDVDDVSELWTSTQFMIKEHISPVTTATALPNTKNRNSFSFYDSHDNHQQQPKQKQRQQPKQMHKQQQQQILFSHSSMSESRQDDYGAEEEEEGYGAAGSYNIDNTQNTVDDDTDVRVLEDTLREKQQSVAHLKFQLNEMRHSILGVRVVDGVTLYDDDDDDEEDEDEEDEEDEDEDEDQDNAEGNSEPHVFHTHVVPNKGNKYRVKKSNEIDSSPPSSSFASIRQRVLRQSTSPRLQINKGSTIVRKRHEQGRLDHIRYSTKEDDSETEDTSSESGEKVYDINKRKGKDKVEVQNDDGDINYDNEEESINDGKDTEASVARLEQKVAMAQARADTLIFEQQKKRELQKELEEKKDALEREYETKSKQLQEMYDQKLKEQSDDLRREFNSERDQHEKRMKELEERLQHRTETINVLGRSLKKLEESMTDTMEEIEWLGRLKDEQEKIISHLTEQTEELQKRNDILTNELAHLSDDSGLSHEALSGTRSHYEGVSLNMQSQLDEKDAQIESLTNLVDRNRLSLQQLRRDMDRMSMTWEERLKTAERKQETLQEDKHKLTQTNMTLKLKVEDLESQLGLCRKQREESVETLSKRLRDTEQKMIDVQTQLEEAQRANSEMTFTLQKKDEEKDTLEEKYKALDTQVLELSHQIEKLNKDLKEAGSKNEAMKEDQTTRQREHTALKQALELKVKTLLEEATVSEQRAQTQLDKLKSKHASEVDGLKREITYREADTEQYKQTAEKCQGKLKAMTSQYQKLVHAVKRRTAEQDHQRKQMELKLKESTQRADYLQSQIELLEEQKKQQRRGANSDVDYDTDFDTNGFDDTGDDGTADIMSRLSDDDLESILADVEGVIGPSHEADQDKTMDFALPN